MHAFGLEETNFYREAEKQARKVTVYAVIFDPMEGKTYAMKFSFSTMQHKFIQLMILWLLSFWEQCNCYQCNCEQRLHFRCVSWRAKSSLNRQPFNFLSCMCEIRHAIRKQNFVVRSVVKCCEFCGKKKIATTLICYARLAEWSKPIKNRKKTAFLIYSSRFLDGFERLQVCRGYFSHDSSHSEIVASARRVCNC